MVKYIKKTLEGYRTRYNERKVEELKYQVEDYYRWFFEKLDMNWEMYTAYQKMKSDDLDFVQRTGKLRISIIN